MEAWLLHMEFEDSLNNPNLNKSVNEKNVDSNEETRKLEDSPYEENRKE